MAKMLRVPYKMLSMPLPAEPLVPEKTVLLLINFQKFTCARDHGLGRLAEERGITPELDEYYSQVDAALQNGNQLVKACRVAGMDVVFSYLHTGSAGQKISKQFQVSKIPVPDGELKDEFLENIKPESGEISLIQSTYSPFTGPDLLHVLEKKGKDTLIVAGMLFNYSVTMTAREAADRDYKVIVVWDASASETLEWHLVTRTGLVGGLILSRSTREVVEMLEGKRT